MPNLRKILEHLAAAEPQSVWTDGKMEMYPAQAIAYWSHLLDRETYYDGKLIELIGKLTDNPFFSGTLLVRRQGSRVVPYLMDFDEHVSKDSIPGDASRAIEKEYRSKPAA